MIFVSACDRFAARLDILRHEPWLAIENGSGIWQAPRRPHYKDPGEKMGLKIAIGLIAAATAVVCVDVSVAWADDTGLASIHKLRRERGRICMADHWHYGSSGTQSSKRAAQRAAMRSWQDFTALEYGSDWARYNRAGSRKINCSRAAAGWSCDVEARPCK